MAFSLVYGFGRMGRHVRRIVSEARSFAGTKFRNLTPSPLRDFLFAQFFAIDHTLFGVFYNDDPKDPRYSMHQKYASKLIDVTACDFLSLCHTYSCSILVAQPLVDSPQFGPQECETTLGILRIIDFIYGGSTPTQIWPAMALKPDPSIIAATMCQEIAQVLQFDPRDKASFSNEWLSLLPQIIAYTNTLIAKEDWSKTAALWIESNDYGGPRR
jgi:hypothetical protein